MELLKHTHIGVRQFRHSEHKRDPFTDILGPHIGGKDRRSPPRAGHSACMGSKEVAINRKAGIVVKWRHLPFARHRKWQISAEGAHVCSGADRNIFTIAQKELKK